MNLATQRSMRSSRSRRRLLGIALALTVIGTIAGCGSKASDAEIAAALATMSAAGSAPAADQPIASVDGPDHEPAAVPAPVAAPLSPASPEVAPVRSASDTADAVATPSPPDRAAGTDPATARPVSKSQITIGQVGPWSGVLGAVTAASPKVLAAWVAHTNAKGGLNGHPIRHIVGDDQGDPGTSLTLVKRMVEADKVIAFVANGHVFNFPQIEKYARERNVPLIGGDAIDPLWMTSPNSFPVTTSLLEQTIKGLKALLAQGSSTIGVLYCLEVSALCSYLNEGVKADPEVGPHVAQTYQVSLVAPSYTSQCLRMQQGGIDTLWLAMDGPGAARAARDCATQGFHPKIMLLSADATPDTPKIAALDGAYIPGGVFPPVAQGVPAIEEYRKVLSVYGPNIGDSGLGTLAWAAGKLFGLAGKNLPDRPTSSDVYDGLWAIKNENLGGLIVPVSFARAKAPSVKSCIFLWGMSDGKWTAPSGAKLLC